MQFKCGMCGERGHNRRSCTKKSKEEDKNGKFNKDVD